MVISVFFFILVGLILLIHDVLATKCPILTSQTFRLIKHPVRLKLGFHNIG